MNVMASALMVNVAAFAMRVPPLSFPRTAAAGIAVRGPIMSAAGPDADSDAATDLYFLERLNDEDRDSALEIDASGVVEEVDERALDAEADKGLDAAVIVVGAGAAGIGMAISLTDSFGLDPSRVLLLERGDKIGTSFRMWPDEMRFISPSFNQAGWTNSFDLNSVAYGSSPAFTLHAQHPSGAEYAEYLDELAGLAGVRERVRLHTEVVRIDPHEEGGLFDVHVRTGGADGGAPTEQTLRTRFVVWAAGEFQYPRESPEALPGAEFCRHNSRVPSWGQLPGDDFVIIGGCESGGDAALPTPGPPPHTAPAAPAPTPLPPTAPTSRP